MARSGTTRRALLAGAGALWCVRASAAGGALRLVHAPLRQGRTSRVIVSGAPPGDRVSLYVGVGGVGPGPCLPAACLGVVAPVHLLASAAADAAGDASLLVPVPAGTAGRRIGLQAVVDRTGAVTDAVLAQILAPPLAPTPAAGLGPYYLPGAPARAALDRYGEAGAPWRIEGHVVDASGAPLVGVDLEVWHADPAGDYDLTTPEMRYRGVMTSGAAGEWCLTTLRPGVYASGGVTRPCHLHVRLSRGGVERLVTQLYPGDDPLVGGVRRALVMSMVDDGAGGQRSAFTFVL